MTRARLLSFLSAALLCLSPLTPCAQAEASETERAYQALEEAERLKTVGALRRALTQYERAYRPLQERSILKRIATLTQRASLSCSRQLKGWRALEEVCAQEPCPERWEVSASVQVATARCEVRLIEPSDRALTTLGDQQVAAIRFTIDHLPRRD